VVTQGRHRRRLAFADRSGDRTSGRM